MAKKRKSPQKEPASDNVSEQNLSERDSLRSTSERTTSQRSAPLETAREKVEVFDERQEWGSQMEFLLSCLGYAVGLGNVWRFPYLAGKHGGGVFLIPYFTVLFLAGLPIFYMEMVIGQFSGLTPHLLFRRMSPLFSGLGYAMVITSAWTALYYNMILAWAIRYLVASFTLDGLPFGTCGHAWNTPLCIDRSGECNTADMHKFNGECLYGNATLTVEGSEMKVVDFVNGTLERSSSSKEYFQYIMDTKTFEEGIGLPKTDLVISLFAAWVLCFLALCQGVKWSGKVVYFTALFPYVLLSIFLVMGLNLDGMGAGIRFFVTGQDDKSDAAYAAGTGTSVFAKLAEGDIWTAAANQLFFSLSIGGGGLSTLSSYNKFDTNIFRDTLIVVFANCATSIFAGFVIFPIIGHVAHVTHRHVSDVAASGTGLAFIVFPDAFASIEPPWLWSILFFFLLVLLGLDSQLVMTEIVITALCDQWTFLRRRWWKAFLVACLCATFFVLGIIFCIPQGQYIVAIADLYGGGLSLVVGALIEVFLVSWVYGIRRFISDIEMMLGKPTKLWHKVLGYPTSVYWWATWVFLTPMLVSWILFRAVTSMGRTVEGGYTLPLYMDNIGMLVLTSCVIWVPLCAFIRVFKGVVMKKRVDWGPILNVTKEWNPAIDSAGKNYIDAPVFMSESERNLWLDKTTSTRKRRILANKLQQKNGDQQPIGDELAV